MTLNDFVDLKKKELQTFADEWHEKHYENPDQYPMSLGEGDWEEQFEFHFQ